MLRGVESSTALPARTEPNTETTWPSDNTLASDAIGPVSTPGRRFLELDTAYHPFGVGELCSNQ